MAWNFRPVTHIFLFCFQELVTLSSNSLLKSPAISNAGKHLSAVEFHSVLKKAGQFLLLFYHFISFCVTCLSLYSLTYMIILVS